jgi:hypothetical protein
MLFCQYVYSQQPTVKHWDKVYGGTLGDAFNAMEKTSDGGFILGGHSNSNISGNKTQDSWNDSWDCWAVKIDSNGQKQWDRRYGGTGDDGISAIIQTADGGYVFAGHVASDISGDKTEASRGGYDFWLVKIDAAGNKQWDKTFGGTGNEYMFGNLKQTADGGYILGGWSDSGVGGDKTEPNRAGGFYFDYWVVKTDADGNKQWDKTFGGTLDDNLMAIELTANGGYLLGGYSKSGVNGDKTQPQIGSWDWWVVKIDSLGNKEWDRVYGTIDADAIYSMCRTHDGNYILGGGRYAKINNNGDTLWTKLFKVCAGTNDIRLTSDNGFIISGTARITCSAPTPDQSENNLGDIQTLIIKTDSAFNKQWDKTIFSPGEDYEGMALESNNGCYVIASLSISGVGGYKSQPSWGGSDYWVVKLCVDSMLSANLTKENGIGIAVYPNPFIDEIAITIEKENLREATFAITTLEGKIIYTQHETHLANRYTKMLDVRNLVSGVYFININTNNQTHTRKIIKQ